MRGDGGGGGVVRREGVRDQSVLHWFVWKRDLFAHHRQVEQVLSGVEVVQKAGAQSTEPHVAIKRGENRSTYSGMVA